ncbi:L-lactate MFS transporter [Geobacter pickeringii]|uniref:MFS transporter n=1 Tax=Geobacter pickeringii TaxID=345632 RepID=A0A0B5BIA7_9BACT|nr:OFA family MFS transporter [Geobacter pickeringii]AJE03776.1 MFS transporter [Geobacter pickeringii]
MSETKNRGWQVTLAGTGINLALGVLYAWSIFKGAIKGSIEKGGPGAFNWDLSSLNDPYAICCLAFAFSMIVAGKAQDKIGPARTALIGGLLVGAGFTIISQSNSYMAWVLGFGVLAGSGFGFGYSAATPPALKWFPSSKTGLIAGIVVAGFGLAPVYIAPLSTWLLGSMGIQNSMLVLAVAFAVVVCGLSFFLANPPAGYVPAEAATGNAAAKTAAKPTVNATASEMLRSGKFYILWITYFIGAGAGLMVIGNVAGIAKKSMGSMAFLAVAIMAIGNAGGRVVAGVLSDKIGRMATLIIMFVFQAALMFAAIPLVGAGHPNAVLIVLLATFIGFNYGANLSLFPSFSKDYWGLKNYGLNYGLLFTAWGVGGFVMGRASEMLNTQTGSFRASFLLAGGMLIAGAVMSFALRPAKAAKPVAAPALEPVPQGMFLESFMRGWADFLGFTPTTPRGVR